MANKKKKLERKIEKEIATRERVLEKTGEVIEEIEKEKKEQEKKEKEQAKKIKLEKKRLKNVEKKAEFIRDDLKKQLQASNKIGKHFEDMIQDYIFMVKLKEDLQHDIDIHGIRYESRTGNGYITDKPNESVGNLLKVNAQMLKILQDLELKEPEEPEEGEGDDLL